jgi:hypothetical protein
MSEEKLTYKNHTIEIQQDDDPFNPRDEDNICIFHIAHKNYSFGDIDYTTFEAIENARNKAIKNDSVVLPLYMYEHSGITISLSPFSCSWDSGQVGFVEVQRNRMLSEFGGKIFTQKLKAKALEVAQHEVETLDMYLRNEIYGYIIDDDGDSCWGFYGEDEALIEAKREVKQMIKNNIKKHCQKVKSWIKNNVPLYARQSLEI